MQENSPNLDAIRIGGETLLPQQQAADTLGKTVRTLENWRARRIGPAWTRIGGRIYYREAALLDWIKSQEQRPVNGEAA